VYVPLTVPDALFVAELAGMSGAAGTCPREAGAQRDHRGVTLASPGTSVSQSGGRMTPV
jgi:hypothetical protein